MTTFAYDTVIPGEQEWGIFYALGAREASPDARIAILAPGDTIGGMTAGSLGKIDFFGDPMATNMGAGAWSKFIDRCARDLGVPTTRLVIPSMAERAFIRMVNAKGIKVFPNERLKTATLAGTSADAERKIASVETMSGNVFTAKSFFDATICCDLSQIIGEEGVHWALGTESMDAYGESMGGYRASVFAPGNAWQGSVLNVMAIADPGLATGAAYDGIPAMGHRVLYSMAGPGRWTKFTQAKFKQANGDDIDVGNSSIYDAAKFGFYGDIHVTDRAKPIDEMSGLGRGALPGGYFQANDDIVLSYAGRPRHWDYPRFNKANPQATYDFRDVLERDSKLYIQQAHYWMATAEAFSGAWQNSCEPVKGIFGWPQREFRRNNGIPWQYYVRIGARPINEKVLSQDDLTVENNGAAKSIFKSKSILLSSYPLDTHVTAFAPRDGGTTEYIRIGQLEGGGANTSPRGYCIPIEACYNSARPNLITIPSGSALATSSLRMVQTYSLAAYAMGLCNGWLISGIHPRDFDYAALRAKLLAVSFLLDPLS